MIFSYHVLYITATEQERFFFCSNYAICKASKPEWLFNLQKIGPVQGELWHNGSSQKMKPSSELSSEVQHQVSELLPQLESMGLLSSPKLILMCFVMRSNSCLMGQTELKCFQLAQYHFESLTLRCNKDLMISVLTVSFWIVLKWELLFMGGLASSGWVPDVVRIKMTVC